MYTIEAMQSVARLHGWKGDEETLPLHLPFGMLRAMGGANPFVIAAQQMTQGTINDEVWDWLITFENDRAISDIIMQRLYWSEGNSSGADSDEGGGEGKEQEGEGKEKNQRRSNAYADSNDDQQQDDEQQDGQGKGKSEGQNNQPQKNDNQQQQRTGNQKPDEPKENDDKEDEKDNDKQDKQQDDKPKSKTKPRGGGSQPKWQNESQAQKALNKWLDNLNKGNKKKQERMLAGNGMTNFNQSQVHNNVVGDILIANKMRSYFEQMSGGVDLELTPRWDVSRLVKRMLTHRALEPAKKWEDGKPETVFMTDISGSCQAVSAAITLAANSACMLGTPSGKIWSLPFNNCWLDLSTTGYMNGVPMATVGRDGSAVKLESERIAEQYKKSSRYYANRVSALAERGFLSRPDAAKLYDGMRQGGGQDGDVMPWIGLLQWAKEMGVDVTDRTKFYRPDGVNLDGALEMLGGVRVNASVLHAYRTSPSVQGALRKLQFTQGYRPLAIPTAYQWEDEISRRAKLAHGDLKLLADGLAQATGNSYRVDTPGLTTRIKMQFQSRVVEQDVFSCGVLAAMGAKYYIYYTDSDGLRAIASLAALLEEGQHLYVVTYACIPNMRMSAENINYQPPQDGINYLGTIQSQLKITSGWVSKAVNSLGWHNIGAQYGRPTMARGRHGQVGISVPMHAYRPRYVGDTEWLPVWFNGNGWRYLVGAKGMDKVTVIPNVDSVDGALEAMRMIAAPDRMALALAGGIRVRTELEKQNLWSSRTDGKGVVEFSGRGALDTVFDMPAPWER